MIGTHHYYMYVSFRVCLLFVCLFVGLLVCWFVGLLVCWFVGLLVCCLLVCWFVGLLVCWFVCLGETLVDVTGVASSFVLHIAKTPSNDDKTG